ncbi:hypothetical protein [Candidatus Protochlamydia phocaeensis]|uniref:hypothetical protein n=1 Tax=Candidatus Protochlamydia phocaeensis TaxID=1414722 RepID=UPI000839AEF1|nr:hypothetical protein [Candidatus Protochlamydia phocaeensis]
MWTALLNSPLVRFLPAPDHVYSSAQSIGMAAAAGALYGLGVRVLYSQNNWAPLSYAACFVLAYQIKQSCMWLGKRGLDYIAEAEQLQHSSVLSSKDRLRVYAWKVIQSYQGLVRRIDEAVSRLLGIRPSYSVTQDNVKEASFLEMCRFRIWSVFRDTILNQISFSIAYRFSNRVGLHLSNRGAVPLFLIIQGIVQNILFIPLLYKYAHFCNRLAGHLDKDAVSTVPQRAKLIGSFLPPL